MAIADNSSPTPNTRQIDFAALVNKADPERAKPQLAYVFSNQREFVDPGEAGGAYELA